MKKPESIIEFFIQMLSKREYLIPIISAQYQFPNHYYGLTSAALLEDLFVDAAINFKNQEFHSIQLERPERKTEENTTTDAKGEKGWDYKFEGENYSHKVGSKIQSIALLWDATYQLPKDQTYSYPSPIVMVLSNYKNKSANLILDDGSKFQVTPISQYRGKELSVGQEIIIVQKRALDKWLILERVSISKENLQIKDVVDIQKMWQKMMSYWSTGIAANQIEVFITKPTKSKRLPQTLPDTEIRIDFQALPGVYLFPKSDLQNVKVIKNNRAILLPAEKVTEFVNKAFATGNFAFLPNWYTCYASNRSVDLYLVQRAEYDKLNSAARN